MGHANTSGTIMSNMSEEKYFKIRLNSLHPQTPLPFDLYIQIGSKYIHYLRAGNFLSQEKLARFEKQAPDQFFVPNENRATFKSYIHDHMVKENLKSGEKALMLRESSLSLVEELFESAAISEALAESQAIISEFVQFIDQHPEGISHLIGLSSHDFYTYNHSLDVAIYSLGLGKKAGYSGADLQELGEGALFHDIGKRHVAIEIICKTGPLDDSEWAQMQKHPQFGLKIMEEQNFTDNIKACCFEHHESFRGNGYPQQLVGEEIHPMARIIAITDTYDALTTKRSYNVPMGAIEAIRFMNEKIRFKYDADLMNAMSNVLFKMTKDIEHGSF